MWHCQGCGMILDMAITDNWCHACLDTLREKLARQLLNTQYGMAYGPALATLFTQRMYWSGQHRARWELPVE